MYYRPYRGYKKNRNRLIRLTLLIFIVFVVLIGVLSFLFLQNYLVFTSEGVKLVLPFEQTASKNDDSLKEPELEIVDTVPDSKPQETETEVPTQPSSNMSIALRSVTIPVSKLNDITYRNKIIDLYKNGIINSVTVDIKTKDGLLNYNTSIDLAKNLKLSSDYSSSFLGGINHLKDSGILLVGQISCFDDDTIPRQLPEMAVKTKSGVTWLDYWRKRHLNPYNDNAYEYLSGIIKESSEMGFSEVILKDFRFPHKGILNLIGYGDQALNKYQILAKRLSDFKSVAGSMKVSVYIDEPMAENGKNSVTGQDITSFYDIADKIYVPLSDQSQNGETALIANISSLTKGDKAKIVPIYTFNEYTKTLIKDSSKSLGYFLNLSSIDYSLDNLAP